MSNAKIKRSKKFLIEFFELYRKQLCLWNNENRYYNDKRRRNQALEILTRKMKEVNPNANRHETLKKINMYRSSFNREQKRREIRDDSGKCRIHKPRLWYYKHLQFLQCAKTTSLWRRDVSNENSQVVSKVRYILPQVCRRIRPYLHAITLLFILAKQLRIFLIQDHTSYMHRLCYVEGSHVIHGSIY